MTQIVGYCCVLPIAFCLVWTAVVNMIGPRRRGLWIAASIPAFLVLLALGYAVLLIYQANPGVIFRSSFGFSPTADVRIIHSYRERPAHIESTYLEFYADKSTIEHILQNGFAPISAQETIECYRAPDWWTPITGGAAWIYATGTKDPEYRGEFRYFFSHQLLIYDPVSKKTFYRNRQR